MKISTSFNKIKINKCNLKEFQAYVRNKAKTNNKDYLKKRLLNK